MRLHRRITALLAASSLFICASEARAQISYNVTYQDVVNGSGFGFDAPAGVGTTRQATVNSIFTYLATQIDGRGTATILWNASLNSTGSILGSFGPDGFLNQPGSLQNGAIYSKLRAGYGFAGSGNPDGDGQINFNAGINWNNGLGAPSAGQYDLYSVMMHEVLHGHGFLSLTTSTGQGLTGAAVGSPGVYAGYDKFIQRGDVAGSGNLLVSNVASASYGAFTGPVSTLTNQNNTSTGLFFGGKYATELYGLGTAVPLYAPAAYASGSSTSHDNTTSPIGIMNFSISSGVRRPILPYEMGMLIDMGYNNYNWNGNTTGTWLAGSTAATLASSNWRTDIGISRNAANNTSYNVNSAQNQAPVMAPWGQGTSNIVVNFVGSGSSAYTSTNDIGSFRLSRITLNSTATVTNTITGGTLIWGQNSDLSAAVMTSAIEQQNTGAFNINSTMQIPNGLTVRGSGSGTVSLGGDISGAGGFTKQGNFTTIMSGNNTYTGSTTVSAGALYVNGTLNGTSGLSVATGATLAGSGTINALITTNPSSFVRPGNSPGTLNAPGGLSMTSGTYVWELGALSTVTSFDQIIVGTSLALGGTSAVTLDFALLPGASQPSAGVVDPFWNTGHQWKILDWTGGGNPNQAFGSLTNGAGYTTGSFTLTPGSGVDLGDIFLTFSVAAVPEPATIAMCGVALVGAGYYGWRRRAKHQRDMSAKI